MPRKKKPLDNIPLVSRLDFENAVSRVLNASKTNVDQRMAAMSASNKARRLAKKKPTRIIAKSPD